MSSTNIDTQPAKLPLSEVVRRNIRAGIVRTGCTHVVFSIRLLGRNPSWLGRRLRKESPAPVTVDELEEIADALGVSPGEMLRR